VQQAGRACAVRNAKASSIGGGVTDRRQTGSKPHQQVSSFARHTHVRLSTPVGREVTPATVTTRSRALDKRDRVSIGRVRRTSGRTSWQPCCRHHTLLELATVEEHSVQHPVTAGQHCCQHGHPQSDQHSWLHHKITMVSLTSRINTAGYTTRSLWFH
jgi:hypothetical protein